MRRNELTNANEEDGRYANVSYRGKGKAGKRALRVERVAGILIKFACFVQILLAVSVVVC